MSSYIDYLSDKSKSAIEIIFQKWTSIMGFIPNNELFDGIGAASLKHAYIKCETKKFDELFAKHLQKDYQKNNLIRDFIIHLGDPIKDTIQTGKSWDYREVYVSSKTRQGVDVVWLLRLLCNPYKAPWWVKLIKDDSCIFWEFEYRELYLYGNNKHIDQALLIEDIDLLNTTIDVTKARVQPPISP
jgi:hypothetical protein